jgi:hypothetical protein
MLPTLRDQSSVRARPLRERPTLSTEVLWPKTGQSPNGSLPHNGGQWFGHRFDLPDQPLGEPAI